MEKRKGKKARGRETLEPQMNTDEAKGAQQA
jgi:hypothetical protein